MADLQILSIDPGETIGVAYVRLYLDAPEDPEFNAHQFTEVQEALNWLHWERVDFVEEQWLIEDYVGSGHLTKEAKTTVKRLGFFEILLSDGPYGRVEVPTPQKRKAWVSHARSLCEGWNITGPHSWDALAHALAWMNRNDIQSPILQRG